MNIWDWVLEAYSRPGVPEACLTLQDAYGQNTSLLLWAIRAEVSDPHLLTRAITATRAFDDTVLTPIRNIRRALKAPLLEVNDIARESLREDVKAIELSAERLLLETLDDLSNARGGAHSLDALLAASRAWGPPAPDDALAALAAALS